MPLASMAGELDRDWPTVVPEPIINVPMRDTAITRGPDGAYYMTGTLAVAPGAERIDPAIASPKTADANTEKPDFQNSRVIKIWRSTDLKKWEDLGVVFDMTRDVFGSGQPGQRFEAIEWLRRPQYAPGPEGGQLRLGLTEPEIHYVKGDWYICFSLNGHGSGLLKSVSGKPEGPYMAWAQITRSGGSPSLFVDKELSASGQETGQADVYFVMDGGWIAKMNDDLTGLAEAPRLIQPAHDRPPAWQKDARVFRDLPRQVGTHGAFLFKHRGRYYLTASEWSNRLGTPCEDTFLVYADSLEGPWSRRLLMIPHGGGTTVFPGPRTTAVPKFYYPQQAFYLGSVSKNAKPLEEVEKGRDADTLYATFSGGDSRSIFANRPSFLPLEWTGPERFVFNLHDDCESFPRKPQHVITERGPWPAMLPALKGLKMRDMSVHKTPDGWYVLSGSIYGHPKELYVYRSKNLIDWEKVGPLWTYDQIEWLPVKLPMPELKPGDIPWQHTFWDTQVLYQNGTYYIAFDIFMNDEHPEHRGCGALKSVSGKLEGPYVSLGKVGGQLGVDPGPIIPNFFIGTDGKLYAKNWINWQQVVAEADLETPGWKWDYKPVDGGIFRHHTRMDPFSIEVVDGKYLFITAGNGEGWWTAENSYDLNYVTAAGPRGPVVSNHYRVVPHASAANFFQDTEGHWWRICFGSDATGPWNDMAGFLPLRVTHEGEELVIDVEDVNNLDERRRKIAGAGQIAPVVTVAETIP